MCGFLTFFCQVELGLLSSMLCWVGQRYQSCVVVLATAVPRWWTLLLLLLLVYSGSVEASQAGDIPAFQPRVCIHNRL